MILLNSILDILKLSVLKLRYRLFLFFSKKSLFRDRLNKEGFIVIENFFSTDEIAQLKKNFVEIFQKEDSITIKQNNDTRLFEYEKFDKFFNKKIRKKYESFLVKNLSITLRHSFSMANIMKANEKNAYGSGGGWHKDSPFSNQFKVFLFLENVKKENGPLCFINKTHLFSSILKILLQSGVPIRKYRFSEEDIKKIKDINFEESIFALKAGTIIIANTQIIHRGAPIEMGKRLAITEYIFDKKEEKDLFLKNL